MYTIIFEFIDPLTSKTVVIKEHKHQSSKSAIDIWNSLPKFEGYSTFSVTIAHKRENVLSNKVVSFETIESVIGSRVQQIIREIRHSDLKNLN